MTLFDKNKLKGTIMKIKSKEQFLQALNFCEVLATPIENGEGNIPGHEVFILNFKNKLLQFFSKNYLIEEKFTYNVSGGTLQSMRNGIWREATESEKEDIFKIIKEFEFKEKLNSGNYDIFNKTEEDRIFKKIDRNKLSFIEDTIDFAELILVKKK